MFEIGFLVGSIVTGIAGLFLHNHLSQVHNIEQNLINLVDRVEALEQAVVAKAKEL
jgi:hypothetical protein